MIHSDPAATLSLKGLGMIALDSILQILGYRLAVCPSRTIIYQERNDFVGFYGLTKAISLHDVAAMESQKI